MPLSVHFGYLQPPSESIIEYGARLFARRDEGLLVPRVQLELPEWNPQANLCHDNALALEARNLGYRAVQGWLLFDFDYLLPFVRFTAHSVVERETGELLDITPLHADRQNAGVYPFIRSGLSHDDFHSIVYYLTEAHGATHLDHRLA